MNQERIGKFIAKCRKEKKMTQAELAEKLGVSDKSIGNWENARCMPDLSLFKPLCEVLEISINDLMSGEKIKKEEYQEKFEENIIHTIDYTNKQVKEKNQMIAILFVVFGILLTIMAMSIFPSESSWGSIYSILGVFISLIGISKFTKKLKYGKRILYNFSYFFSFVLLLFIIDYMGVFVVHQAPRFSYRKETISNMIIYNAPLYTVYRINFNTKNEYYVIDTKNKYTKETVPNIPFNRDKSGIENLIKYKNKYVGNNSNDGNLISSLPLSEYGYVFSIDTKNLGLSIYYHVTNWYIDEFSYLEKSLLYNSVSIFSLIDNVKFIEYHFSGKTYQVTREKIEEFFPHYKEIIEDGLNKEKFIMYVENRINDEEFVEDLFNKIFD